MAVFYYEVLASSVHGVSFRPFLKFKDCYGSFAGLIEHVDVEIEGEPNKVRVRKERVFPVAPTNLSFICVPMNNNIHQKVKKLENTIIAEMSSHLWRGVCSNSGSLQKVDYNGRSYLASTVPYWRNVMNNIVNLQVKDTVYSRKGAA